ncbi:NADAR family protein [Sphingosinicella sp. BN140058]|uniref:NADAR family protein n=1 Tax=Sphingosinicella sp. BN140058 TaxID=1892855 RepID=UPI0013EAB65F|nr:NADAR family protein [Sphingosinicella sp. BN140058]
MRTTPTHIYFWHGPLSNWSKPSHFIGADAFRELMTLLAPLGIAHPRPDDPISHLLCCHRYNCGEQWMMAVKAWFFGDVPRLRAILEAWEPKDQKAIGRDVTPFSAEEWNTICVPAVTAGTLARAEANPALCKLLLDSGDRQFVEGSPVDRIWGVGLRYDDPRIDDQRNWRGRNLLGTSHALTRTILRSRGR